MRQVHPANGNDERQTQKPEMTKEKHSAWVKKTNTGNEAGGVIHQQVLHHSGEDVHERGPPVPLENIFGIDVVGNDNEWISLRKGVHSGHGVAPWRPADEATEVNAPRAKRIKRPQATSPERQTQDAEQLSENGPDTDEEPKSGIGAMEQPRRTASNASLTFNGEPKPSAWGLKLPVGEHWENLRATIEALYLAQNLSLSEVMRIMKRQHNFHAR